MTMPKERPVYCTSFCNCDHYMDTGRPIAHECYVIPPRLLRAECDLPHEQAVEVWHSWYENKGWPVKGRVRHDAPVSEGE